MTAEEEKIYFKARAYVDRDVPKFEREVNVERLKCFTDGYNMALSEHSALKEQWISVEERLPEIHEVAQYSERVLVITNTGKITLGYLLRSKWISNDMASKPFIEMGYNITHWQPLPTPPVKK